MKFDEVMKKFQFDIRIIEWNIKNKVVTRSDIDNHVKSLPDVSANVTYVNLEDSAHH